LGWISPAFYYYLMRVFLLSSLLLES
jgi:hypothetical protein